MCFSENVQAKQNEKNKPSYVGIYTEKWIFYIWITDDYKKKDQRDCTYIWIGGDYEERIILAVCTPN
jgi:hypothetical protein